MFGNKEKDLKGRSEIQPRTPNRPSAKSSSKTILGEGARFVGDLSIDGSIEVHGELEGTLTCTESLIIGKSGKVKAEVEVRNILVTGCMIGSIIARERVELETGSHLEGDVQSQSFMIQDGVFFQGNCSMGENVSTKKVPAEATDLKPELGILKQP